MLKGDIWFAAQELLKRGGDAELRDYQLNEDLAAQDGLVCGGTMYFLIDPVRDPIRTKTLPRKRLKHTLAVRPWLSSTSRQHQRTPELSSEPRCWFARTVTTQGGLGDEVLEAMTVAKARDLMAMGKNDYLYLDDGTECYIEAYTTPPTLVLIGGGHVSKAIAPIAKSVGFRIFVFDDREQFSNPDRFPEADITMVGDYRGRFRQNAGQRKLIRGRREPRTPVRRCSSFRCSAHTCELRRPARQQAQDDPHLRGADPKRFRPRGTPTHQRTYRTRHRRSGHPKRSL